WRSPRSEGTAVGVSLRVDGHRRPRLRVRSRPTSATGDLAWSGIDSHELADGRIRLLAQGLVAGGGLVLAAGPVRLQPLALLAELGGDRPHLVQAFAVALLQVPLAEDIQLPVHRIDHGQHGLQDLTGVLLTVVPPALAVGDEADVEVRLEIVRCRQGADGLE